MNVKIYVWTYCPFCQRAELLLDQKGIPFERIVLDGQDQELEDLRMQTGHRTVPQIFIDENFIGGFDQLNQLNESGELDNMMKKTMD